MLTGAWRIGSIRGIDIRIHSSWLIIALLVAWSFWARFVSVYGYATAPAIAVAIVASILFFASVLAHELAHSLEALHRGVQVGGITLFLFGGVTETRFDVKRPRDEFTLTAIGPFTSFVLAALFGIAAAYATLLGLNLVADVTGLLGWINLMLGAFNLLPGAPLDGGRILRSIVWWGTGDRGKAVRAAAVTGQVIGGFLVVVGLSLLFFLRGGAIDGVWFAFIGWFLVVAARQEVAQHELQQVLEGRSVAGFLDSPPRALPADATAADAADELRRSPEDLIPITEHGETIGIVRLDDVASVPGARRPDVPVRHLLRPVASLPRVAVHEALVDVLDRFRRDEDVMAVFRDGEFAGLLSRRKVLRALQRDQKLDHERKRRQRSGLRRTHLPGEG
ncbi:MAG: site-2 protease family protein [Actinomycetota bacterium]|nr:site-2 protease family protein [Actinomycetota bacterium]